MKISVSDGLLSCWIANQSISSSGVALDDVPELTDQTYLPGGMTALYDAIAEGVRLADNDKTEDERVICVIMTDGEENSSRETTEDQVKDIISGQEGRGDWTFLYIGENPDRWVKDTGMSAHHGLQYQHHAPRDNYMQANIAISHYLRCK